MPPGCTPDRGDVGFEVDDGPGTTRLLVSRGVQYAGPAPDVGEWLRAGGKEFASFSLLRAWFEGPLRQAFPGRLATVASAEGGERAAPTVNQLTDMATVHRELRDIHRPLSLDEAALFDRLSQRVLGQDDALRALAAVMVRHCARRRPARPAVILATGPSGVGKTRTAEVVPEVLRDLRGPGQRGREPGPDRQHESQFLRMLISIW